MTEILLKLHQDALSDTITSRFDVEAPTLNDEDCQLAHDWMKSYERGCHEDSEATMFSARMAEKAVADYFRSSKHQVEDISITKSTDQWKNIDLKVNGIPFDVKNARSKFNKPRIVSWHIQLFASENSQIKFIGTISQYCTPLEKDRTGLRVRILGSVCPKRIFELETMLSQGPLAGRVISKSKNGGCFIPPWLFDYDPCDYIKRDIALQAFRSKTDWNDEAKSISFYPSMALGSGHDFEPSRSFTRSTRDLALLLQARIHEYSASLPLLFLTIFEHCIIESSRKEDGAFNAPEIRSLIFPHLPQLLPDLNIIDLEHRPLFLFDPTTIVDKLLTKIESRWPNRKAHPIETDPFTFLKVQKVEALR